MQNIGAYGVELESVFEELTAIERNSQVEVTFNRDGCEFAYRDSIFKNRFKDAYIISSVTLSLNKNPNVHIEYPALRDAIDKLDLPAEKITPTLIAHTVCEIRRSKLPNPEAIPNAGSFFQNPVIDQATFAQLKSKYPDVPAYPQENEQVKIPAAWLIDRAGWKGREEFGVGMHRHQALVLVNPGNKSGAQILEFAEQVRADIDNKFGIDLRREPVSYL